MNDTLRRQFLALYEEPLLGQAGVVPTAVPERRVPAAAARGDLDVTEVTAADFS